jgi:hypothetical protein
VIGAELSSKRGSCAQRGRNGSRTNAGRTGNAFVLAQTDRRAGACTVQPAGLAGVDKAAVVPADNTAVVLARVERQTMQRSHKRSGVLTLCWACCG